MPLKNVTDYCNIQNTAIGTTQRGYHVILLTPFLYYNVIVILRLTIKHVLT